MCGIHIDDLYIIFYQAFHAEHLDFLIYAVVKNGVILFALPGNSFLNHSN
jgi:hypothetical protein